MVEVDVKIVWSIILGNECYQKWEMVSIIIPVIIKEKVVVKYVVMFIGIR